MNALYSWTLAVFSCCLFFSCGQGPKPVDNPSIIDLNPQFEEAVPAVNKTNPKIEAIKAGQPELVGDLTNYEGQKVPISTLSPDKPKLLAFWAAWDMNSIKQREALLVFKKNNPEITVLSISVDPKLEEAKAYLLENEAPIATHEYWIGSNIQIEQPLYWYTFNEANIGNMDSSASYTPKYVLISKEGIILNNDLRPIGSKAFSQTVDNLLKS